MIYIGIDPGVSGGIGWLGGRTGGAHVAKMPQTEHDVAELLRDLHYEGEGHVVVTIEKVGAMPKQGVASTFKFGLSYGFLRGVLVGLGLPFIDVRPAEWQRVLGCLSHGDKNVTKAKAQQLYPELELTHATADALLLATYCARQDWRGVVS